MRCDIAAVDHTVTTPRCDFLCRIELCKSNNLYCFLILTGNLKISAQESDSHVKRESDLALVIHTNTFSPNSFSYLTVSFPSIRSPVKTQRTDLTLWNALSFPSKVFAETTSKFYFQVS